jgi:hypothetical protein
MSSRILDADELGEKGESRFREICADARITCNQSTRDRTGWDFLVEFPFEGGRTNASLDKRPLPISAHVQVKTVWTTASTVRLRLSSAERLAKEPKPTFIYAFRVNEKLEFEDSTIIHIFGDSLARILKRLRKEESRKSKAINRKTITIPLKSGIRTAPTASALIEAIQQTCAAGLAEYIERKAKLLNTLGYEPHRFIGSMTFQSGSMEALVDASLGLREIEVCDFQISERRFGIELPVRDKFPKTGTVKIQPQALSACKIIVSGSMSSKPAAFCGEIFTPAIPNLPVKYRRLQIRSPFLEASLTKGDETSISVHLSVPNKNNERLKITEWTTLLRLIRLISDGDCRVEIAPETERFGPISFNIPKEALQAPYTPEEYDYLLAQLQAASNVFSHAGAEDRAISWEDLTEKLDDIAAIDQLIQQSGNPKLSFTLTPLAGQDVPDHLNVLTVNFLAFAGRFFAYSGIAEVRKEGQEGEDIRFESTRFVGLRIRELPFFPRGYAEFTNESKGSNTCQGLFVVEPQRVGEEKSETKKSSPSEQIT